MDLVYYGNQRHLEYDFMVAPHADPRQIRLHFAGAQRVRLNAAGDLVVRAQGRKLRWQKPIVYQQDAAGKHRVPAGFRLKRLADGQEGVSFALGRYDTARTLIIDPKLLYSTYLGGKAFYGFGDESDAIAVDSGGNAYLTGEIASNDFPTTSGAYQTTHGNAFVTKLNPTGTALVYSTLLGGATGGWNQGKAIAVDSTGNAYVTGIAQSDLPTTPGAYQRIIGPSAGPFVVKLNPTGSALVYATFLTGSEGNETSAIAVDSGGNAYVAGDTESLDFPVTPAAFQQTFNLLGGRAAFVTKFNPTGSALVYSTFLAGNGDNRITGIAVNNSGNAYVFGTSNAADFPVTPGAFQTTNHANTGRVNGFVTKLSPIPIFPDFNNEGFTDLLLQNSSTNAIISWFMIGTTYYNGLVMPAVPPAGWNVAAVGDYNGDGVADLVFQSPTSNQGMVWYLSPTGGVLSSAQLSTHAPAGWNFAGPR